MEQCPPRELLLLEAGDVYVEVPNGVPQGSDVLIEQADVWASSRVKNNFATRQTQRVVMGGGFHEESSKEY